MTTGFIFDAASIAVLAIAFIIGLVAGFAKQTGKVICTIVGIVGGVVGCFVVMNFVLKTSTGYIGFYSDMMDSVSGWFKGKSFTESVAGLEVVSKAAQNSVYAQNDVAKLLGEWVVNGIVCFLMWLVAYLVVKYVLRGINLLLRKLAKVPVFKSIDRIFGGLWAIVLAYLLVFGVAYTAFVVICVKVGGENIENLLKLVREEAIGKSTVFKFLCDYNFIGIWWAKFANVDLVKLAKIGEEVAEPVTSVLALVL